jgi:hypothetical protein
MLKTANKKGALATKTILAPFLLLVTILHYRVVMNGKIIDKIILMIYCICVQLTRRIYGDE